MYSIPIKIEGIERRKRGTGLLHIAAALFLIANAGAYYKQIGYQNFLTVLPIYLVALISLAYGLFRKKFDPSAQYNHWVRMLQFLMFSILGIFMWQSEMDMRTLTVFLWAIICIPLLFTERKVFHDASLSFSNSNITIPGYFSTKVVPWSVVESVVVRNDFVTIHYPNNKYVQYEVLDQIAQTEIEKINRYCQQQIDGTTKA
jgi:hypothetical protein